MPVQELPLATEPRYFRKAALGETSVPRCVPCFRRLKLSQSRHRRKQINLGIRQCTLPFLIPESVACN